MVQPERQLSVLSAVEGRIQGSTGHQVRVAPAPQDFNEEGTLIEVHLDGALLGAVGFDWVASWDAQEAAAELRDALSVLLDEEFPDGWW